jgi:hypothetical protein
MSTSQAFSALAQRLLAEHRNVNGCWFTNYARIEGLKVKASDTNGTSGLGTFRGVPVYWHMCYGLQFDANTQALVKVAEPSFAVERR